MDSAGVACGMAVGRRISIIDPELGLAQPVAVPAHSADLPPSRRRWAALAVLLGLCLSVLSSSVVNLALPGLAQHFRIGAASAVLIVSVYQVSTLCLLLPFSALGDRLGYRRVYGAGALLFTLASVGAACASSIAQLLAMRMLQGVGIAALMSVGTALVRQIYPARLLGRAVALNGVAVSLSAVLSPMLAALLLEQLGWPWVFLVNVAPGGLVMVLAWRFLPRSSLAQEARTASAKFVRADVALNVLTFVCLFMGLDGLGRRMQMQPLALSVALLALGAVLGGFYWRRQTRLNAPVFPTDLLQAPVFALAIAACALAYMAQSMALLSLPFLLLGNANLSTLDAGLLIGVWPLASALASVLAGRLVDRVPGGVLAAMGALCLCAGLVLLAGLPASPHKGQLFWRIGVCGAGFSLFQVPNVHTIVRVPSVERSGAASGMMNTARIAAQVLGAAVVAGVFATQPASSGATAAWVQITAAALTALAAILCGLRARR